MFAKKPTPIEEARAGDIIALVSLAETETGDTLCDSANPVVLERMRFRTPVISVSVKSKVKAEQEEFNTALGKMFVPIRRCTWNRPLKPARRFCAAWASCTWRWTLDVCARSSASRARWVSPSGLPRDHHQEDPGKLHPQRADRRFGPVRPKCGSFSSRSSAAPASYSRTRQSAVPYPREFVPAVEKGLKIQKEDGVLAHFPTVDFKATLIDGSYHDVDSNALTFEIAAKAAFREGLKKAGPILLEPVMKVETVTPQDHLGDVIGDINRRRGTIQEQIERGNNIAVGRPFRCQRCWFTSDSCAA